MRASDSSASRRERIEELFFRFEVGLLVCAFNVHVYTGRGEARPEMASRRGEEEGTERVSVLNSGAEQSRAEWG